MCSGARSNSANGAMARGQWAALGWSTPSSSVLSLWTIRGPFTPWPFARDPGASFQCRASRAETDRSPLVGPGGIFSEAAPNPQDGEASPRVLGELGDAGDAVQRVGAHL